MRKGEVQRFEAGERAPASIFVRGFESELALSLLTLPPFCRLFSLFGSLVSAPPVRDSFTEQTANRAGLRFVNAAGRGFMI